jgi:hypothetical protein
MVESGLDRSGPLPRPQPVRKVEHPDQSHRRPNLHLVEVPRIAACSMRLARVIVVGEKLWLPLALLRQQRLPIRCPPNSRWFAILHGIVPGCEVPDQQLPSVNARGHRSRSRSPQQRRKGSSSSESVVGRPCTVIVQLSLCFQHYLNGLSMITGATCECGG